MPLTHLLVVAFAAFGWSSGWMASRYALDAGMPPLLFSALRFGAVGIAAFFVPRPLGWPTMLAIGVTLGVGAQGLPPVAVWLGFPPGVGSLALQSQVFITVLLGVSLLGERPGRIQWLGMALGATGIVILATAGGSYAIPAAASLVVGVGATSWAIGNLVLRLFAGPAALPVVLWQALVAAVPIFGLSVVLEGAPMEALSSISHPWVAAAALAYAALVSTLGANVAWTWLLKRHPASTAAPATMLVPVFGLSLAHVLFDEALGPRRLAAVILVIAGLVLALRKPRKPLVTGELDREENATTAPSG